MVDIEQLSVILFIICNFYFSYLMFKAFIFLGKMKYVESQRRPSSGNAKGIFKESKDMFSDYRKNINEEYSRMKGEQ